MLLFHSILFEGVWFQTIVIAAPLREASLAAKRGFVVGTFGFDFAQTLRFSGFHACPPSALAFKAFLGQNRALLRVWRTCVLQTSVFIEWIGPRVPLTPKVCSFVILFVCTLRKHLKNTIQSRNCVLRKAFLSFSLRFCSAFKMHCKTRLKIKSSLKKRGSLHTCSHESRFFEIDFEKTVVV